MKKIAVIFILMTVLLLGAAMADTLVLPEDTIIIETEAFYGVDAETIILPEGVTTIEDLAFGGSETLQRVFVPDELMSRESAALQGSSNAHFVPLSHKFTYSEKSDHIELTRYEGFSSEVTVPSTINGKPVTVLSKQVFDGNETITKVVIPEGVTSISDYVFRNCSNLTDITFPDSLTSINKNAFSGCGTNAGDPFYVRLPDNLGNCGIGDETTHGFTDCDAVLVVSPESNTAYRFTSNAWFTFEDQYDFRFQYKGNDNNLFLMKYVGDGPVAEIADDIGLEIINDNAFLDCTQLTKVIIPEGVNSIRQYAFSGCSNLTDITFPQSLTDLNANAFIGCGASAEGPFYFRLPDSLSNSYSGDETTHGFNNCKAILVVSPDSKTAYRFSNNAWITFEDQYDYRYRYTGNDNILNLIKYVGTGSTANIPGNVELKIITSDAFKDCTQLTKVIIPEGVTTIRQDAFSGCSNLTDITFPHSLTDLNANAFIGCGSSSEDPFYFRLPDNLGNSYNGNETTHGFTDCNAILVVTPKSVTAYRFSGNSWFTFENQYDYRYRYISNDNKLNLIKYVGSDDEISIPDNVELQRIYSDAFLNNTTLTTVVIPDSVTSIEASAFEGCRNLTDVTFPSSLDFIGYSAFRFCGANSEDPYYFVLPDNISGIKGYGDDSTDDSTASFYGCKAIKVASGETTGRTLKGAHYNYYLSMADALSGDNPVHWDD